MPRVGRIAPRDHIFRILTRGNNRQDVFRDEIDYLKYLEILNRYQEKYQFKLYHQAGRMKMGRFYFLDLEEWNGVRLGYLGIDSPLLSG